MEFHTLYVNKEKAISNALTSIFLSFSLLCLLQTQGYAEISKITPRVFLSDMPSARSKQELSKHRITHILDVGKGDRDFLGNSWSKPTGFRAEDYYSLTELAQTFSFSNIPMDDSREFSILPYFDWVCI